MANQTGTSNDDIVRSFFRLSNATGTTRKNLIEHFGFNTHQFCYFKKHVKFSFAGTFSYCDIDVFSYEVAYFFTKYYSIANLGKYNWYDFWSSLRKINSENIDMFKHMKIILNTDSTKIELVKESPMPGIIFSDVIKKSPFLHHLK